MTLRKKDYQDFMKRLRKNTGQKTIKYYACGEYGPKTDRPHFHAIIFDVFEDQVVKAWGKGNVVPGTVTGESIAYVTKYICKERRIPAYQGDDRQRESALMSLGLGKNYITPQQVLYHTHGELRPYVIKNGGFKMAMPRYYRDKIFTLEQRCKLYRESEAKYNEQLTQQITDAGSWEQYVNLRNQNIKTVIAINNQKTSKRNKI